jgi:hypothetical protein
MGRKNEVSPMNTILKEYERAHSALSIRGTYVIAAFLNFTNMF